MKNVFRKLKNVFRKNNFPKSEVKEWIENRKINFAHFFILYGHDSTNTYSSRYESEDYKNATNSDVFVAEIVFPYRKEGKWEFSVSVGDILIIERVFKEIGWVLTRKFENLEEIGYVPLECFSRRKGISFRTLSRVIVRKEWYSKGDLILTLNRDNLSFYPCIKIRNCFDNVKNSGKSFLHNEIEEVKLKPLHEFNIVKKKERVTFKELLMYLPFRVIIQLTGTYFLYKVKSHCSITQFYGKFANDRNKKLFCDRQSLLVCWAGVGAEIRLLPVRHLRHIEYYHWSDGGHVPYGSWKMRIPLEKRFWKSCINLQSVGDYIVKYDSVHKKHSLDNIGVMSRKLERIRNLVCEVINKKLIEELSTLNSIKILRFERGFSVQEYSSESEEVIFSFPKLIKLELGVKPSFRLKVPLLRDLTIDSGVFKRELVDEIIGMENLRYFKCKYCLFEKNIDVFRIFNKPSLIKLEFDVNRKENLPEEEGKKMDRVDLCESNLEIMEFHNVYFPDEFFQGVLRMKRLKKVKFLFITAIP